MLRAATSALVLCLPAAAQPFYLRVIDAATDRGVPLVELRTTQEVLFVTDSDGIAVVDTPELQGRDVFFHVRSHGYELEEDGFGYRGLRCRVDAARFKTVRLTRRNVAERLYRVTGAGIYRDSVLAGRPVPIAAPLLNGGVTGQDSVVNAVYRGKLYWFWGDTNRAAYPLGNFAVSGATSVLPQDGGLAPERGVDLRYFVGADGFSRKMCPIDGPGPVWVFGAMVVEHEGRERLLSHYARMKSLGERYEHGIVEFDDAREVFAKVREFPLATRLHPSGNPCLADGWFYFTNPYPAVRVRARYEDIVDPERYEAFVYDRAAQAWRWQRGAEPVEPRRAKTLNVPAEHRFMTLRDVETGTPVLGHGGTVGYSPRRKRWVMIALETFGRSMLGEVWFAEADSLLGPWGYARRIVTHDDYSFYNVKHHPYFSDAAGRWIYFEGTYTATFSGARSKTPRYDYNQVMYRLDLDHEALRLPVPVYEVGGTGSLQTGRESMDWAAVRRVAFWALPSGDSFRLLPADDARKGTVPVYEWTHHDDGKRLATTSPGPQWTPGGAPAGRAWPAPAARPPLPVK